MVYYNLNVYNDDMFLVGVLSWWYRGGLIERWHIIVNRLKASADFFSINLLFMTLFSPFRQISADERSSGGVNFLNVLFDKLLSRFIGAFMRIAMIIAGLAVMLLQFLFGIIIIAVWLLIPLLPVVGLIMTTLGVELK